MLFELVIDEVPGCVPIPRINVLTAFKPLFVFAL
ncbi:hypothetical protein LSH36_500g02026 [Paralvinella palmiformis]|uniref:Uncharacterized protein n=1 Tax=Paralvinella palmiformis TaxID=53620 RepID=A0AAD9J8G1_9ANNE|nr:hypothetical protein LSH36_500g02026 [Paralvinella palmiformis]